jgi:hypothetical protein
MGEESQRKRDRGDKKKETGQEGFKAISLKDA